jgi:hypothetical protein
MAKEKVGLMLKMGIGKRRFSREEMGLGKGYGLGRRVPKEKMLPEDG